MDWSYTAQEVLPGELIALTAGAETPEFTVVPDQILHNMRNKKLRDVVQGVWNRQESWRPVLAAIATEQIPPIIYLAGDFTILYTEIEREGDDWVPRVRVTNNANYVCLRKRRDHLKKEGEVVITSLEEKLFEYSSRGAVQYGDLFDDKETMEELDDASLMLTNLFNGGAFGYVRGTPDRTTVLGFAGNVSSMWYGIRDRKRPIAKPIESL